MDDQPNVTRRKPFGFRPLHSFTLRTLLIFVTLAGTLCAVGMWLIGAAGTEGWVGDTDLEVDFVVTDEATGQPVEGAAIVVQSDEGKGFSLATDRNGLAHRICLQSMYMGQRSGIFRTETFVVDLPWSNVQVSASGYATSQLDFPQIVAYQSQATRLRAGSTLTIRVPLNEGR